MSDNAEFINQIVAEVLSRLGVSAKSPRDESGVDAHSGNVLRLKDRVITGDLLTATLNGHVQLEVSEKAVLTPSARDLLRAKRVEVCRSDAAAPVMNQTNGTTSAFIADRSDGLQRILSDLGIAGRTFDCPDEAAEQAADAVSAKRAQTAFVFSRMNHRAAMLANKHAKVRAAAISEASDVRPAVEQMRPNVWCIDATDRSYFELKNLITAVGRA